MLNYCAALGRQTSRRTRMYPPFFFVLKHDEIRWSNLHKKHTKRTLFVTNSCEKYWKRVDFVYNRPKINPTKSARNSAIPKVVTPQVDSTALAHDGPVQPLLPVLQKRLVYKTLPKRTFRKQKRLCFLYSSRRRFGNNPGSPCRRDRKCASWSIRSTPDLQHFQPVPPSSTTYYKYAKPTTKTNFSTHNERFWCDVFFYVWRFSVFWVVSVFWVAVSCWAMICRFPPFLNCSLLLFQNTKTTVKN